MRYVFKGTLRGSLGPDASEPLAGATVKLYRVPRFEGDAAPAGAFSVLRMEEEEKKAYLLFAMTRTDASGAFRFDVSAQSQERPGYPEPYAGEPFQVDVLCRDVPGRPGGGPVDPVQFTLGTVLPTWRELDGEREAAWDYVLSRAQWGRVRAFFDAWVVTGVVRSGDGRALQGVRVQALDRDMMQDDALGEALTDEAGRFRIDYSSRQFRRTMVPGVGYEPGGPDLYFRVTSPSGRVLLDEWKAGREAGVRDDIGGCYHAELQVAVEAATLEPPGMPA